MKDNLQKDFYTGALSRTLDLLLKHKRELFSHLQERWRDLFGAKFDVLLYDLTATYFESVPPEDEEDKRRFGYSREQAWPAPTCASREAHWVKAQPCAAGL